MIDHKNVKLTDLWEVIKFRLLAMGDDHLIEKEIERMVSLWQTHIDSSSMTAEDFRNQLYNIVREGMQQDAEAFFKKKKH